MSITTLDLVPLTSSLEAASEARRTVRQALAGAGEEVAVQASLLVDEMVASVLATVGGPIQLVVERRAGHLVVEVVGPRAADGSVADGLGVARVILDSWAADWGVIEQPAHSSIWFGIDVPTT